MLFYRATKKQKKIAGKSIVGKSKVDMIWDTVEVTLSLLDMELHLQFEGYKLDKFIKVKI